MNWCLLFFFFVLKIKPQKEAKVSEPLPRVFKHCELVCDGVTQDGMWQKWLTLSLCACYGCSREGNEPGDELTVTYRELLRRVCRFANVLKSQGAFNTPTPLQRRLPVAKFPFSQLMSLSCVCRGEEGRPCVHLHADGGGAGGRHVGVRSYRSRSLHRGEFGTWGCLRRVVTWLQAVHCVFGWTSELAWKKTHGIDGRCS